PCRRVGLLQETSHMRQALSRRTLSPIEALKRDAIIRSLEETGGDKQATADALGMSRATIYRKIREFGINL
ncbi:hypothetical protein BS618_16795, partial [Rhodococcus erythropolis]